MTTDVLDLSFQLLNLLQMLQRVNRKRLDLVIRWVESQAHEDTHVVLSHIACSKRISREISAGSQQLSHHDVAKLEDLHCLKKEVGRVRVFLDQLIIVLNLC